MIQVIRAYPPNFERIAEALPAARATRNLLFTHENLVYNPDGAIISPWLADHEAVHVDQQLEMGVDPWWDEYLANSRFRLEQELAAVVAEYRGFCHASPSPNRSMRAEFLDSLAFRLSGHLYGHMIRKKDAKSALKSRIASHGG